MRGHSRRDLGASSHACPYTHDLMENQHPRMEVVCGNNDNA